jgi:hypothetical protein
MAYHNAQPAARKALSQQEKQRIKYSDFGADPGT